MGRCLNGYTWQSIDGTIAVHATTDISTRKSHVNGEEHSHTHKHISDTQSTFRHTFMSVATQSVCLTYYGGTTKTCHHFVYSFFSFGFPPLIAVKKKKHQVISIVPKLLSDDRASPFELSIYLAGCFHSAFSFSHTSASYIYQKMTCSKNLQTISQGYLWYHLALAVGVCACECVCVYTWEPFIFYLKSRFCSLFFRRPWFQS